MSQRRQSGPTRRTFLQMGGAALGAAAGLRLGLSGVHATAADDRRDRHILGCHTFGGPLYFDYPGTNSGRAAQRFNQYTGLDWGLHAQKQFVNAGAATMDALAGQGPGLPAGNNGVQLLMDVGCDSFVLSFSYSQASVVDANAANMLRTSLRTCRRNHVPVLGVFLQNEVNLPAHYGGAGGEPIYASHVRTLAPVIAEFGYPLWYSGGQGNIPTWISYFNAWQGALQQVDVTPAGASLDGYFPQIWYNKRSPSTGAPGSGSQAYLQPVIDTINAAGLPFAWGEWGATSGGMGFGQNPGTALGTITDLENYVRFIVDTLHSISAGWSWCSYWNTNVNTGANNTVESAADAKIPALHLMQSLVGGDEQGDDAQGNEG